MANPADLDTARAGADVAARLSDEIQQAVALLRSAAYVAPPVAGEPVGHGTLLQQCLALCTQQQGQEPEPVRTVHHFACSGGTLLSKCIAAMPNVQLLSEVDPLSETGFNPAKPRFAPTDMVTLLRQSTRGIDHALTLEMFRHELNLVRAETLRRGQRLVLRDHAHSHFCRGTGVPERPSLRDIVAAIAPVRSVLTVRHPVDSFASLVKNGWVHFKPATFEAYCARYLRFLDAYEGVAVVRYEDFVASPASAMQTLCEVLALPFSADFEQLFPAFRLTGDSGRASGTIEALPRRPEAQAVLDASSQCVPFLELAARLGYAADAANPVTAAG